MRVGSKPVMTLIGVSVISWRFNLLCSISFLENLLLATIQNMPNKANRSWDACSCVSSDACQDTHPETLSI